MTPPAPPWAWAGDSDGASDAYIQDVVVRRDLRGRGIGAEIVRRLTARCRRRGLDWVGLRPNPARRRSTSGWASTPGLSLRLMLHEGDRD